MCDNVSVRFVGSKKITAETTKKICTEIDRGVQIPATINSRMQLTFL